MSATPSFRFTLTQWLVLIIAAIGFLFDTYELLMTPLVGVPGIAELLNLPPNNPLVSEWMGRMLWMTALCGGVFGMAGGWLIDRFGRKTIMACSILLYAGSPFAAAFSTSLGAFIFFRCTTFIGVCVEFIAAITWLAELFPNLRQKEIALGATQAFASLGGVFVTLMSSFLEHAAKAGSLPALPLPEIFDTHAIWRYTLMTGIIPAIPIALLLPFVPESKAWRDRRSAGTLRRPSFGELFSPSLRRVTLVTAGLSACAYGAAFGALQLTPRSIAAGVPDLVNQRNDLAPLLKEATALNGQINALTPAFDQATAEVPGLRELATQRARNRVAFRAAKNANDVPKVKALSGAFAEMGKTLDQLTADHPDAKKVLGNRENLLRQLGDNRQKQAPFSGPVTSYTTSIQQWQENGGLIGRIALALLIVAAIKRRLLLRLFIIPALIVLPVTYFSLYHFSGAAFNLGIALSGFLVVAQFSFFGEYLPKVFPLHLRGTGGSFATNVGGRMIGTSAALVTTNLIAPHLSGANNYDKVATAAGLVGLTVFVIALILSFQLPEPKHEEMSDAEEGAKAAVQNPAATPAA
jgi:MFS family permease